MSRGDFYTISRASLPAVLFCKKALLLLYISDSFRIYEYCNRHSLSLIQKAGAVISAIQYTLIKIPVKEIVSQGFHVALTPAQEREKGYLISQPNSLIFDQIQRLRGSFSSHIPEMILVTAKKNPRQEESLRRILQEGFSYNGVHFSRFGKSASQGKAGITAFVCDRIWEELYTVSQMDIPVERCVISKYEAQRCLLFSSCTLVPGYMPNIVIIGEYEKVIPNQFIKYVTESMKKYEDPETGEMKAYKSREINEGFRDIPISPFDGCGCHEEGFSRQIRSALGLDYRPAGVQIRLPFLKGYSVYMPFRSIFREWGIDQIVDIYGHSHPVEQVDCIWNISMFKGHPLFLERYGREAWNRYRDTLKKYSFKMGISKYSHLTSRLGKMTRMNFQYLQCLNLWNPEYVRQFEQKRRDYDILSEKNEGKIISIARYTTGLYEKILAGDPLYACKFLGIADEDSYEPESRYLEAVLINKVMLKDPAVKQFLFRRLKKAIQEAKVGKIYVSGFYHAVVGDMIGYLEYACGREPAGCLNAGEFFCRTLPPGDCVSFRSPLVCPSEVNKVTLVSDVAEGRWLEHFQDQDVAMLNMYDISAPQQGGADYDGDIMLLCTDRRIIDSKIEKPVIIDIEDKATVQSKPYTKEHLVEYEIMTRDNRIGEITNAATSIENKYTANEEVKKLYSDFASLLRVFQGKEIDFLKTGFRWQMNKGLRKHLKQLPYFLLYNYPQKMKTYERIKTANQGIKQPEEKLPFNVYHSPSPMNELCDYICTWERRKVIWNREAADVRPLILNQGLTLDDRTVIRAVRHYVNRYAEDLKKLLAANAGRETGDNSPIGAELLVQHYREELSEKLGLEEEVTANYVIQVSYSSLSLSKSLAWAAYGEYIIKNLASNSPPEKSLRIVETPCKTDKSADYLGRYYELKEGGAYL